MPGEELLDIRMQRCRRAAVLALVGEFDITGRPRFREEVARLAAQRPPLLILDLQGLTFIDARGLGALVHARTRAAAWSGRLLLVAATPRVRRVLRVAGLAETMPVYESVEEAIAAQVELEVGRPCRPPPVGAPR